MKYLTALFLVLATFTHAQEKTILLSSTTSTQNSGLYDYLLPKFTADTGIFVKVVAVGTGQAIRIAKNGDADALLVHHRPSEDAFVNDGYGSVRYDVMYNDFVLVGPKTDGLTFQSLSDFFGTTNDGQFTFISRGDDSGTHKKELELWQHFSNATPKANWYREIGSGMGAALNMASATNSYTLSDRGTWLSFGNKGDLEIKLSGAEILQNPYGLILVNPEKYAHVRTDFAKTFAEWMTSPTGQKAIGDFRVGGKQLFCPTADKSDPDRRKACPAN
jgi:tungstate transport system substrate-binding protein